MSTRILVTGANGFTGRWMMRELARQGVEAIALSRTPGVSGPAVDLADADAIAQAIEATRPDGIIHLASRTPANSPRIADAQWVNDAATTTINLLDAVRRHAPEARTLVVSSSAVYGHVPTSAMPIREDTPLRPTTMYGVSKATQELIAARFHGEFQLAVVVARPFNIVGAGEPHNMLTSALARQIVEASNHTRPVISLRHRVTQRDYTDIRDVVRAYWLLLERGQPGEIYNVCSGQATSIGQVLDDLLDLAGVDAQINETSSGPGPHDILVQQGSSERLSAATGWQAHYSLRDSLRDLLASLQNISGESSHS